MSLYQLLCHYNDCSKKNIACYNGIVAILANILPVIEKIRTAKTRLAVLVLWF
jgi:hypothetical protein